jgi:hypothetical protein
MIDFSFGKRLASDLEQTCEFRFILIIDFLTEISDWYKNMKMLKFHQCETSAHSMEIENSYFNSYVPLCLPLSFTL